MLQRTRTESSMAHDRKVRLNAGAQIGPIALPLRPRAHHSVVPHVSITNAAVHCSVTSFVEKGWGGCKRERQHRDAQKVKGGKKKERGIARASILPDFVEAVSDRTKKC